MRIYIDESGTHGKQWLVIGMLFVTDHGPLHAELCAAKDEIGYFNTSPKYKAKYKETHLTKFRSRRDVNVAEKWADLFAAHTCYFRSIVVDWSIWDGKYFGNAFEAEAIKQRRAYKKWAEMIIRPETRTSEGEARFYHAKLYLDKLRAIRGYDVLDHLENRFIGNYQGESPFIDSWQLTDSWKDANQCLQLCDLLAGSIYQKLVPSNNEFKLAAANYLEEKLKLLGVESLKPSYWRQYAETTPAKFTQRFPKFSVWFWKPVSPKKRRKDSKRR
jgi:Protein of unknown function (DUF3800)